MDNINSQESQVIQPLFLEKVLEYIESIIFRAKIKINGEYFFYEKFKVLHEKDNTIRIYFYIEDRSGLIEEAHLLTNSGEVLAYKEYSIDKNLDGLVLTFAFSIKIDEVDLGYID